MICDGVLVVHVGESYIMSILGQGLEEPVVGGRAL